MQPLNQEIVNDHTKDIGHRGATRMTGSYTVRLLLSGPTGVPLQMSDIKLIPNLPIENNNDR